MATAPATAAQADALIMALRGATPMQGQASTLKFYDNPENSVYTPRVRPVYVPPPLPPGPDVGPQLPAPAPPVAPAPTPLAPAPIAPTPIAPAPRPSIIQPKSTLISLDDDPVTPDVPDYTDDLFGPDVGPPSPPGPDVGPVAPAQTYPVYTPPLFTSRLIEEKSPSVEVIQDLPVSTDPAPPTDAADDFELDRELGIVSQYDVFGPDVGPPSPPGPDVGPPAPAQTYPVYTSPPFTSRLIEENSPSVTVIEGLDVTDAPAVNTDPADNFELDRELGIIQQSDMMEPITFAPAPTLAPATEPATSIRDAGFVTQIDPLTELEDYAALLNTDITSTLPAAVAEDTVQPSVAVDTATQGLTQRDLDEMALFDMLSQQLLTGNDYWDQLLMDDPYLQER
jgi:hypothetical protein